MRRSLFVLVLLGALISIRASATTVTGTVTDPDSTVWANGSITFTLTGNAGQGYSCAGTPMTPSQTIVVAALNGSGTFSTTLCANNTITPVNTQWAIQIVSATTAPPQTLTPTTVSGSSQDLTTYINGLITAIRIPIAFGTRAYTDTEIVSPVSGNVYFNLTSALQRIYNGSTWINTNTSTTTTSSTLLFSLTTGTVSAVNIVTRSAPGTSGAIFQADYENYQCVMSGFHNVANTGGVPIIQFSTDGGTTWDTANNYGWAEQLWKSNAITGDVRLGTVSSGIPIVGDPTGVGPNITGVPSSATFTIYSPFKTSNATVRGTGFGETNAQYMFDMGGYEATNVARNAMRIVPSLGATFTFTGVFRCYGLTN